jgi:hypothetical protein
VDFNGKNSLNLGTDSEDFTKGTATNAYATTKASLSFGLGSVVLCTEAQLEAIGPGNGTGSGIDSTTESGNIPPAGTTAAIGTEALRYCDGGTGPGNDSGLTPSEAFGELATVEADPSAQAGGSDGTSLGAIWQAGGTGAATL